MSSKLRVALIFGGRSAEHEISILSARAMYRALDRERFEPILIGIDRDGTWRSQPTHLLERSDKDPRKLSVEATTQAVSLARPGSPAGEGTLDVDVAFPVLHGPYGEDGTMQGMLEVLGVPYVGAGVLGSAVAMDKDVMKRVLAHHGLPVVPWVVLRKAAYDRDPVGALQPIKKLGYPAFVKPANLGSSVGVSRVRSAEGLTNAIEEAFRYDEKLIVEGAVDGVREIECGVLGGDDPEASVLGELVVDHPDGFYSYAAKYLDDGARPVIPAELPEDQANAIRALAVQTFIALECHGLARVDFFVSTSGEAFVNELNSIPGMTEISMYPKLWEASGIPPKALVSRLIDLALERAERRKALKTSHAG